MRPPNRHDPIKVWLWYYIVFTPIVYLFYVPLLWWQAFNEKHIAGPLRVRQAKRRLKKDGIDHLVDL